MRPPAPASALASSGSFRSRVAELRALVDEVAGARWVDPRWWALLSAVALAETRPGRARYLLSDAGAAADTFMAWPAPQPRDPVVAAIGVARAARAAIAELDGTLPDQPLAATIARGRDGAALRPTPLDAVAFAIGDRVVRAPLCAADTDLAAALAAVAAGRPPRPPLAPLAAGAVFACIALGDDAWGTARHGHRRAWTEAGGPWLGVARVDEHLVVSTCHYAIDGFGHAALGARLAAAATAPWPARPVALPPLARVPAAAPLAFAWRAWPGETRATTLAYRAGLALGAELGYRRGRSPTIQIPVAPGAPDDPARWRRRVLPAIVSVRAQGGVPEPAAEFARRAQRALAREAAGRGLASRVLAAGRALPVPTRWKRDAAAPSGAPAAWLAPLYDAIAGRACVSAIRTAAIGVAAPPAIAVSMPARDDATGATVITLYDAGAAGAILTVAGTGRWGSAAACEAVLDQLAGDR